MTHKQRNGFLRFLLDSVEDAMNEADAEKKNEKIRRIYEHLRDTIED